MSKNCSPRASGGPQTAEGTGQEPRSQTPSVGAFPRQGPASITPIQNKTTSSSPQGWSFVHQHSLWSQGECLGHGLELRLDRFSQQPLPSAPCHGDEPYFAARKHSGPGGLRQGLHDTFSSPWWKTRGSNPKVRKRRNRRATPQALPPPCLARVAGAREEEGPAVLEGNSICRPSSPPTSGLPGQLL